MPSDEQLQPTTIEDEPGVGGCSCGMADYGAPGHDGDLNATLRRYYVEVERTELIRFELDAVSAHDAAKRYLYSGDETASDSSSAPTVIAIGLV